MQIDIQPKFNLGETVSITTLGIPMDIEITKRTIEINIDNTIDKLIYYDLEHTKLINGWTWNKVSEERLTDWINESKHASKR